jgi:hypothetical protein
MDIEQDVINRVDIPRTDDGDLRYRYHSDRLVAAAVTQAYLYMITGLTQYGYISTGLAFVFLHISFNEPDMVYYYLAEPNPGVDSIIDYASASDEWLHHTAVRQVLAFCVLPLKEEIRPQSWWRQLLMDLPRWNVDFEKVLREIPEDLRHATPSVSEYMPSLVETIGGSGIQLRSGAFCRPSPGRRRPSNDHESDDDVGPAPPGAPRSPRPGRTLGSSSRTRDGDSSGTQSGPHTAPTVYSSSRIRRARLPYCTQNCLKGLQRRTALDRTCPNISLHCNGNQLKQRRHQLNVPTFLKLLHEQLAWTMDDNCWPLAKHGARGTLFKVRLASHGYTFAAKGTVPAFVSDLRHELRVYQRL